MSLVCPYFGARKVGVGWVWDGLGWMCETRAVHGMHHLPMIVGQAGFLPGLVRQ